MNIFDLGLVSDQLFVGYCCQLLIYVNTVCLSNKTSIHGNTEFNLVASI